jgi:hypothetical protein
VLSRFARLAILPRFGRALAAPRLTLSAPQATLGMPLRMVQPNFSLTRLFSTVPSDMLAAEPEAPVRIGRARATRQARRMKRRARQRRATFTLLRIQRASGSYGECVQRRRTDLAKLKKKKNRKTTQENAEPEKAKLIEAKANEQ